MQVRRATQRAPSTGSGRTGSLMVARSPADVVPARREDRRRISGRDQRLRRPGPRGAFGVRLHPRRQHGDEVRRSCPQSHVEGCVASTRVTPLATSPGRTSPRAPAPAPAPAPRGSPCRAHLVGEPVREGEAGGETVNHRAEGLSGGPSSSPPPTPIQHPRHPIPLLRTLPRQQLP